VTFKRYRHLDVQDLARLLESTHCTAQRWIVTESLFSMSGSVADLSALCDVAEAFDARVIVDEAHASGAYGNVLTRDKAHASGIFGQTRGTSLRSRHASNGHASGTLGMANYEVFNCSGLVAAQGVSNRVSVQLGTAGKALGSHGAWVAGDTDLIDWLTNACRSFIYTTAPPPATLAATIAAIELLSAQDDLPLKLHANIQHFWRALETWPEVIRPPKPIFPSHIIPIVLGENDRALAVSQALHSAGCYVRAIRPPTVPDGQAMLRLSLSAAHTPTQITLLCEMLQNMLTAHEA
jgi:8-amino-7-oxononanoate synthase